MQVPICIALSRAGKCPQQDRLVQLANCSWRLESSLVLPTLQRLGPRRVLLLPPVVQLAVPEPRLARAEWQLNLEPVHTILPARVANPASRSASPVIIGRTPAERPKL
jgi:hypothetical protein